MQKREKILAALVAGLFAIVVLWLGLGKLMSAFDARRTTAGQLADTLKKQQESLAGARRAMARRAEWPRRSLPRDSQMARSLYQNWLFELVGSAGLTEPNIKALPVQIQKGVYEKLSFNIDARATLPQLTRFLYDFYRADHLHQIRRLNVIPDPKSRQFNLDIIVEAMILTNAVNESTLNATVSNRLAKPTLAEYQRIIEGRNLFAPPNRAPVLERIGSRSTKIGQPLTIAAKARDEDPQDKLTYSLDEKPQGAAIDPASGKFQWTPSATLRPGAHTAVVRVTDTGVPAQSVAETFTITVEPYTLRLAPIPDKTLEIGQSVAVTARPAEADPAAKVTYALVGDAPAGATLDPKSGEFRWTPAGDESRGSHAVTIRATDDANPPGSDAKTFKISLVDPKPVELVFDFNAKNTFVTAIFFKDGDSPEVWLLVRPTGEVIKLPDNSLAEDRRYAFKAGSFQAKVIRVRDKDIILEAGGRRIAVGLGKSLADFKYVDDADL